MCRMVLNLLTLTLEMECSLAPPRSAVALRPVSRQGLIAWQCNHNIQRLRLTRWPINAEY